MYRPHRPALLLGMLLLPPAVGAQEELVIPRLTGSIVLDGRVDEPAWEAIAPLPVTMHTPTFGQAPSERTEFRVAYDDHFLYASGRLFDSDSSGIRALSLRRDEGALSNDWFCLNLDTFRDRQTTLLFGTTPSGLRTDVAISNDGQSAPNFDWNTFWDAAATRSRDGWSAEIRIPLSSLRFQEKDGRVVMGLSLWRRIARKNEMITYPAIPPNWGLLSVVKASQMQVAVLTGLKRKNPVYLTPYLLGGTGTTHALNGGRTAYEAVGQTTREAGLDLKYGLTPNLTLDLTYNTDFAQVEADDQQVNLTRFSLFFPEKRGFFQERDGVFDFATGGSDRLFYSRRIGISAGRQVPLRGGARLVGRVGTWDVGVLGMQTSRLDALPTERFGVARLRRQILNPNSYVGGIFTHRSGETGRDAVYGLDALLRVHGQDYLSFNWAQSFTRADSGTIRPLDRGLARARWQRRGTDGLFYALDLSRVGPAFDPTLGFQLRRDYTRLGDLIGYGWRPGRTSPILRHALVVRADAYRRNEDGLVESSSVAPSWQIERKAGHNLTLGVERSYERLERPFRLSDDASVPAGRYGFTSASLVFFPPNQALLRSSVRLEAGSFYDGRRLTAALTPTWNASRHLEMGGLLQSSHIDFPERDQRFLAHVARLRARWMLDTRLSLAGFVQYNSAVDAAFANLRLRFNPREGDDLYLVLNAGLNTDRYGFAPVRPLLDSHTLMVKYSRTLGLGL